MSAQNEAIKAATAATLRHIAPWIGSATPETLYGIAEGVDVLEADDLCCPVCEEVDCDESCPLVAYRREGRNVGQVEA